MFPLLAARRDFVSRFAESPLLSIAGPDPAGGVESAMTIETEVRTYPFLLAGEFRTGAGAWEIRSPWSGELIGRASLASRADVTAAIDAAAAAAPEAAAMPSHARATVLDRIAT